MEDRAVGSLFKFVMTLPPIVKTPEAVTKKRKIKTAEGRENRDIREMFNSGKKKKTPKVIVIDE